MTLFLMLLVNLLVGLSVGLTGIAGFLLPMFYTGFLGMPSTEALALSFAAFLLSGILGSINFYKSGNLDIRTAAYLSAGSILGALAGVKINLLIPEDVIKIILYAVVLLSGISILLRKDKKTDAVKTTSGAASSAAPDASSGAASGASFAANTNPESTPCTGARKKRVLLYVLLGFVTGAVCAASGAGGPVLVMPLLTLIGFPAHMAVGIALFNSVFIALPAVAGYFCNAAFAQRMWLMLPALLAVHGIGVFAGSKNAAKINQTLLKRIVAAGSILIACIKLFF